MSRHRVNALAVLLAMAAGMATVANAAPPRKTAPEVVTFTFAWPSDVKAAVTATRGGERVGQGRRTQTLAYRLEVRPGADGITVLPGAFEVLLPGATPDAPPRREPLPFQYARLASIAFRVDRDGHFVSVVDLPQAQQLAREMLQSGRGAAPSAAALDAATSRDVLEAGAREYWDPVVGNWAGTQFAIDVPYEFDDDLAAPALGIATLPAKGQVLVRRAPACDRGGRKYRCVYVELEIRVDGETLAAAFAKLPGAPAGASGPPIRDGAMVATSTLLVEPETLVPHEFDYERVVRFTPNDPGAAGEITIIDVDRREFAYSPVAAPAAR